MGETSTANGSRTRNKKLETRNLLLENLKLQKRLADNHLIAVLKHMTFAGKKSSPAIYESAVGRPEVFDEILAVMVDNAGMPSRYLGLRIIFIQIDIREYAAVRIPAADIRLNTHYWKLFADS